MAKTIEEGIKDVENKTEDIRKLEKLGDNHFKLTVINEGNRIKNIKEFDKKELKAIYVDIKDNVGNLEALKKQSKAKAKILIELPLEEQDKIEDFIHMLSQVKQYQEAEQAKASIPNIDDQLVLLTKNMKEIEVIVPEVLRNK